MESNYFGKINNKEIADLDSKQRDQALFNKGILIVSYSTSTFKETEDFGVFEAEIELSENNIEYLFSPKLAKEVYQFLIKHYKAAIGHDLAMFNRDFDNDNFGLTDIEIRKKGLAHFNEEFELARGEREIGIIYNDNSQIGAEKRFKTLYRKRNDFINELQNITFGIEKSNNLVMSYLFGDIGYFDKNLFETDVLLQNILKFENILTILLSLNNKFKFEEENHFSPKSIAQQIYEQYSKEFSSLKLLRFLEQELSIEKQKKHGYIVSLFFFFKKEEAANFPTAKLFLEILNSFFDLKIGKIKLSDPTNTNHKARMNKISLKWNEFT